MLLKELKADDLHGTAALEVVTRSSGQLAGLVGPTSQLFYFSLIILFIFILQVQSRNAVLVAVASLG
jgi:hypothetical protein